MTNRTRGRLDPCCGTVCAVALLFFAATFWASYARWADFRYRTFDLAFYVQGLWQFLHGRFAVTIEPVPILGNHFEPIVFLLTPLFALFQHPLTLVVAQNAALATMGPVAYDIGKRLGLGGKASAFLASALILAPALGFTALHEFHPEALAAPLLLLLFRARLLRSLGQHWIWFVAVLICKENMALLLAAYCVVQIIWLRRERFFELMKWYGWALLLAVAWFLIGALVVMRAFNSGEIDYVGLYSQIGTSGPDIIYKAVTQPQLMIGAMRNALAHGNLVWVLLLPFLGLPLLKPKWLLIAAPILLQHLLSWRSSEWNIYFHYAAPLLPLFWMATAESVAQIDGWGKWPLPLRSALPVLVLIGCLVAQCMLGPAGEIALATTEWFSSAPDRARKNAFLARIPPRAGVVAPLAYLSHLALREKAYSLHHILKGLKTLSRQPFEPPPPPDFVLIDYGDSATFDAESGYYHPTMRMADGRIIPSSDQRLHSFLSSRSWQAETEDALTLLRQAPAPAEPSAVGSAAPVAEAGRGNHLLSISRATDIARPDGSWEIKMTWNFDAPRKTFPWLFLRLTNQANGQRTFLVRGLCAPEAVAGARRETWRITPPTPPSSDRDTTYALEAIFVDNTKRVWTEVSGRGNQMDTMLCPPIPLGNVRTAAGRQK